MAEATISNPSVEKESRQGAQEIVRQLQAQGVLYCWDKPRTLLLAQGNSSLRLPEDKYISQEALAFACSVAKPLIVSSYSSRTEKGVYLGIVPDGGSSEWDC